MLSWPRSLSPRTRLDPMKPAAPVTTMNTTRAPSGPIRALEFQVHQADVAQDHPHARRERAQELVADRRGRARDVVDGQALAPKHRRAADARLGHVREVDRDEVH